MEQYQICYIGGEGEIVEKKSRFIAHIVPIDEEQDAITFIEKIRKQYWDARHNCYAYITKDGKVLRFSDDGEPSQTAGKPMLDILTGRNIQGICVVVTRYFGGVLLGTGGLVRAYQAAVLAGLEKATICTVYDGILAKWTIEYDSYGKFNYLIETFQVVRPSINYGEKIDILTVMETSTFISFAKKILEESAGKIEPREKERISFIVVNNEIKMIKK